MTARKQHPATGGRPTKYHASFCERLVDHMDKGLTYASFAAEIGVHRDTLLEWEKRHPAFSGARKRGLAKAERFYLKLLQSISTGQLRRLESEEPATNDFGKVLYDEDGNVLMKRTYAAARTSAAAAIFLSKNVAGMRDQHDISHAGPDGGPIPVRHTLTPEQRSKRREELTRLAKSREECGFD